MNLLQRCKEHRFLVVVVSGKIGSGKTTLCDAISRLLPERVICRNFADRLKEEVALHLDMPLEAMHTHEGKNTALPAYGDGMTVGSMLQQFGSTLRNIHPQFWINAVESWLERRIADDHHNDSKASFPLKTKQDEVFKRLILIGDGRFPNEIEWVKTRCGGMAIRLEGDPVGERARSRRDLMHVSETSLDDYTGFDLVLDTNCLSCDETAQHAIEAILAYAQKSL